MTTMRAVPGRVLVCGCMLILLTISTTPSFTTAIASYPDYVGPFVDEVVYKVIESQEEEVLALLNDEIDLIGSIMDTKLLETLESSYADIDVEGTLRNSYGYLLIKTNKYPLNITYFRRAFAFALDKERICEQAWDGLAVPQDSLVPQQNPFSIEGQLPYTYYTANIALGSELLDSAGFLDDDSDGFREAPDGSDFDITVEVASSSPVAIEVGEIAAEALQALDIDAVSVPTDFYEYLNRLYFHGDFDIVFLGEFFTDFDVDWLAFKYWSEYADEPYWNFPIWRNATYDSWRDQLLHSADYDEVYQAAVEMQKVWVYECPAVVCYQSAMLWAHRTNRFEGFVNDAMDGVPCRWTNYRIHLKDSEGGPYGGEFRLSDPLDICSFNFMFAHSAYEVDILSNLYDSLIIRDSDGRDRPWLAESYIAETHADNLAVPDGHTRFTFALLQNATWTDGSPLTGEDVAFTLNYYRDAPGNPCGVDLSDLTAAYAPTTYSVVADFSTESYWHLHTIAYKPIIPKHVFQTITPAGWNTWNPSPPNDEMVTSGPFNVSGYVSGEFCELTYSPDYFHSRRQPPPPTTTSTSPTEQVSAISALGIAATTASSIVISFVVAYTVCRRRRAQVLSQNTNASPNAAWRAA